MLRSVVLLILALAGACNSTAATGDNTSCVLLGATIRPSSATLHPGDTLRLAVIGLASPCGSSLPSQSYRWSSSDTSTARVDLVSGLVTARQPGITTIISALAADPNVKSAMLLRVEP